MERTRKDIIDDMREIVKPKIGKMLLKANYEGLGKTDKDEFEYEFEIVLGLAETALEHQTKYYPPCEDCHKKMDEIRRTYDKLKKQEPCTDAVSREAVLNETIRKNSIWNSITNSEGKNLEEIIFELPPVNPQPSEHFIDGVHAIGYREGYKDAQKQKSGKWIDVNDRLPEEYGEYLITWKNPKYPTIYIGICECEITDVYDREHNRFEVEWLFDGHITTAYPGSKVIAWMPLPEPYKEEGAE